MHSPQIKKLIDSIENEFGAIEYYGSPEEEEHGVCFKLAGIRATFSILALDSKLKSSYDIQIEGIPAGDYLYTCEVTHSEFINLVQKFKGPESKWP